MASLPPRQATEVPQYDYDLYVIGAGSGGVRAARIASTMGARVAIAEDRYLGGTCVNVGCVPKKLFSYAAHFHQEISDANGYGWTTSNVSFDWPTLRDNKTKEIERLNGIYGNLLSGAGVELHDGRATLVNAHTVEVAGKRFTAKDILVAVGGRPFVPSIPGGDVGITSDDAFHLEELPEKVLVVGGGYIGVEFAGIFNGLGVETTLVYRKELFLRGFDDDVRTSLAEEMRHKGIELLFNHDVVRLEGKPGAITASLTTGGQRADDQLHTCEVGQVLFATGRVANTRNLGLEAAGIAMDDRGNIPVDALSKTNVESVWAIGDVTDRLNLTPVAIHEAMCLTQTLYADNPTSPDHDCVATAIFSDPEIGTVGLSEKEARAQVGKVVIYRSSFRPLKYTLTENQERTMMKLIVDGESDRVLGVHVMGRDAAELVQGLAIAVKMGATKADFDSTMGIHPTSGEELVTMRDPVSGN